MGEKQPMTKKLPATTTVKHQYLSSNMMSIEISRLLNNPSDYFVFSQVGRLKFLCESFFKLKSMKLKLFLQEEVCFFFKNKLCYFNNIRTILKISFNLPPLMLRNKLVGEINCFMDFNFQGSPLPLLLDNDASSLMDYGVGNDSVILVDEDS
jgi:hypothetical protein